MRWLLALMALMPYAAYARCTAPCLSPLTGVRTGSSLGDMLGLIVFVLIVLIWFANTKR